MLSNAKKERQNSRRLDFKCYQSHHFALLMLFIAFCGEKLKLKEESHVNMDLN